VTPRVTDSQSRKDNVLGIVVEQYIRTVTPVSSGYIAENYNLDLSSATIRNILADLEEQGYLTHPHTSAGRMPTQQGYRYYVDNLMHEIKLLEAEKNKIVAEYRQGIRELEFLLEKTSEVLSQTTHYTGIISLDGAQGKIYCRGTSHVVGYPELQDVRQIQGILSALEEKERLLKVLNRDLQNKIDIYIGQELTMKEIQGCSLAVSMFQIKNGPSGRMAVLGPTRMDYERVVSTLEYMSELMQELL